MNEASKYYCITWFRSRKSREENNGTESGTYEKQYKTKNLENNETESYNMKKMPENISFKHKYD